MSLSQVTNITNEERQKLERQNRVFFAGFFQELAAKMLDTVKQPSAVVVVVQFNDGSVAQFRRAIGRFNLVSLIGALDWAKNKMLNEIEEETLS